MIARVSGMVSRQTRALAQRRVDADRAADPLDVGLDDVHADTAAGDVGDLGGGGESGLEDHRHDVAPVHLRRPGIGADAGRSRRPSRRFGSTSRPAPSSETSTVDVPTLVVGPQRQGALGPLAGGDPPLGLLDAVVDGVAHQVGQRVLDRLQQAAVELGLLALHDELDLLAEPGAEVADDAGQLRPDVVDRLHPGLHDAFLQLAGDRAEPLGAADEGRVAGLDHAADQLVAGQDQLSDQVHQAVEQVDVDPDRAVGDAALRGPAPAAPR